MTNKTWLKHLREKARIKQEDLAARLQLAGQDYSRSAVSGWENGYYAAPLDDVEFRNALAHALGVDVSHLLKAAGYEVSTGGHSEAAERVAIMVDQLPPDKQDLAVRLIEQLARA